MRISNKDKSSVLIDLKARSREAYFPYSAFLQLEQNKKEIYLLTKINIFYFTE